MSLQKAQLTCLYVPALGAGGCVMGAEWHQRVALPHAGMQGQPHSLYTSTHVGHTG